MDRGDCGEGFGFGAGGEVDLCVFGVEDLGELFADAGVGAGYNVYLRKSISICFCIGGAITFPFRSGTSFSVKRGFGGYICDRKSRNEIENDGGTMVLV